MVHEGLQKADEKIIWRTWNDVLKKNSKKLFKYCLKYNKIQKRGQKI